MKRLLISFGCLTSLSAGMAYATWLFLGPPDRSVVCAQAELPEYFVCLKTVERWPQDEVLWVDARPREDWEKDGREGSVLVNDQEDWFDLEAGFMQMIGVQTKILVYCNRSGCGSSKYVADQLRSRHAETFGFEVFVLEGGAKALSARD